MARVGLSGSKIHEATKTSLEMAFKHVLADYPELLESNSKSGKTNATPSLAMTTVQLRTLPLDEIISRWRGYVAHYLASAPIMPRDGLDDMMEDFFKVTTILNERAAYQGADEFASTAAGILNQLAAAIRVMPPTLEVLNIPGTAFPTAEMLRSLAQKAESVVEKIKGQAEIQIGENTLDYKKIISIIYNAGKDMEKRPDTYVKDGEERLRDHLLRTLNALLKGDATAETFSHKGKTDIYIQLDSEKAFVAECKIWGGKKKFLEAVDQLFGNLNWRYPETVLIVFNRKQRTSKVVAEIRKAVKDHNKFKRPDGGRESGITPRYIFRHPQDQDLELILTVLVFDLPK
ncbi:MAG: hypothetical protein A2V67_00985 [Deltaproteobacteria bacterium RBG_13_61_14]|nr:MAG: hypothetical protein A2V67_00985 [Deltaproteobacteria bacterium RBG_13_61_14]